MQREQCPLLWCCTVKKKEKLEFGGEVLVHVRMTWTSLYYACGTSLSSHTRRRTTRQFFVNGEEEEETLAEKSAPVRARFSSTFFSRRKNKNYSRCLGESGGGKGGVLLQMVFYCPRDILLR